MGAASDSVKDVDMPDSTNILLAELVEFLTPVADAIESPAGVARLLQSLGHDPTAADLAAVFGSLAPVRQKLEALIELLEERAEAGDELDEQDYARIASDTADILQGLHDISGMVTDIELGPEFFGELLDRLVAEYLRFRAPLAFRLLMLLGVIESEFVMPGRDAAARAVGFEKLTMRWDRLGQFLDSPSDLMKSVYGWGTTDFDGNRLLTAIALLFDEFGVVSLPKLLPAPIVDRFTDPPPSPDQPPIGYELPLYQELTTQVNAEAGLLALPIKGAEPPVARDRGLAVMPYVEGMVPAQVAISDDGTWTFHFAATANLAGGMVFSIHPSGLRFDAGVLDATAASGSVRMELQKAKPAGADTILLHGDRDGTRLEAASVNVGLGGDDGDFYVAAAVRKLRLVIDASDDGLLSRLISEPITADAGDVVAGWRPGRGIYLEQGSGLSVRIPLNVDLFGVLRLHELGLRLDLDQQPSLTTLLSAGATIGPLAFAFEDLGLELTLTEHAGGSFGVFDLDARILLPTGYAAALDLGPVAGGGALFRHDHEYRGALALEFETMGFSAFAILTTRLPGGRDGFSFVASVFGEFDIPLGYGFFLTGLGGVIGINRAADSAALREVVAGGTLDDLLFPADPIAQAPRILDALADVFPVREGIHVLGPVARIVFGRPTLVEGRLGLVLEVGDRMRALVVGLVSSDLPSRQTALVSLRASFFGEVDLAAGTISLDTTLNPGSRVLMYAISGDMAARTGWGSRVDHVISFGGLHPAYPRPANLPDLQRLSINFGSNNPRVTLSAYLAVTTNSLQFGAEASLYAKGPDIMFVGQVAAEGEVYLHALVYFDPFAFDAKLGGHLSLLVDGDVILSLGFDLRLSGPNPFRVAGRVWATVWGVDVGFGVNHSWGDEQPLSPPTTDPVIVLRDALTGGSGLEPIPSTTRVSGVVFPPAAIGAAEPHRVADPAAGLQFVQRAVPLGVRIEKLGDAVLTGGAHQYDLAVRDAGGDDLPLTAATADFVRGHFWALSEEERLRAPAFERYPAGFVLGGEDLQVDPAAAVTAEYGYEIITLPPRTGPGSNLPPPVFDDVALGDAVFDRWSGVHRREVAQPLNPPAVAGVGEAALALRTTTYIPLGGTPDSAGPLSQVLESEPARGRTAPANPAVATYVATAAA
jgi:hypothetical protein